MTGSVSASSVDVSGTWDGWKGFMKSPTAQIWEIAATAEKEARHLLPGGGGGEAFKMFAKVCCFSCRWVVSSKFRG